MVQTTVQDISTQVKKFYGQTLKVVINHFVSNYTASSELFLLHIIWMATSPTTKKTFIGNNNQEVEVSITLDCHLINITKIPATGPI